MIDVYRTVASRSDARFEVNDSEFIGYVSPAETVEEAEASVTEIEEHHPDATHNVPAYRVPVGSTSSSVPGEGSVVLREYQSDDGEPSDSSGKPTLNVPVQQDVRNVAAVVTRYYGGTNLGIDGLTHAYSRTVKEALDAAGTVEEIPHKQFTVTVEYDDSRNVRGLLESAGTEFGATYKANVSFEVRVPVEDGPGLRDHIRNATNDRVNIG